MQKVALGGRPKSALNAVAAGWQRELKLERKRKRERGKGKGGGRRRVPVGGGASCD